MCSLKVPFYEYKWDHQATLTEIYNSILVILFLNVLKMKNYASVKNNEIKYLLY